MKLFLLFLFFMSANSFGMTLKLHGVENPAIVETVDEYYATMPCYEAGDFDGIKIPVKKKYVSKTTYEELPSMEIPDFLKNSCRPKHAHSYVTFSMFGKALYWFQFTKNKKRSVENNEVILYCKKIPSRYIWDNCTRFPGRSDGESFFIDPDKELNVQILLVD